MHMFEFHGLSAIKEDSGALALLVCRRKAAFADRLLLLAWPLFSQL